jgi:hypothetical protein
MRPLSTRKSPEGTTLEGVGERKRKTWVLDTGTKGTGAEVVPLEKVLTGPSSGPAPAVRSKKRRAPVRAPQSRGPRRFKVVDVMTGAVLAEDVDARAALDVLAGVRAIVDARVYVWQPGRRRWRILSPGEQKTMWERRLETQKTF